MKLQSCFITLLQNQHTEAQGDDRNESVVEVKIRTRVPVIQPQHHQSGGHCQEVILRGHSEKNIQNRLIGTHCPHTSRWAWLGPQLAEWALMSAPHTVRFWMYHAPGIGFCPHMNMVVPGIHDLCHTLQSPEPRTSDWNGNAVCNIWQVSFCKISFPVLSFLNKRNTSMKQIFYKSCQKGLRGCSTSELYPLSNSVTESGSIPSQKDRAPPWALDLTLLTAMLANVPAGPRAVKIVFYSSAELFW